MTSEGAVTTCVYRSGAWVPLAPNRPGMKKGQVTEKVQRRATAWYALAQRIGRRPHVRELQRACGLSSPSVALHTIRQIERADSGGKG